MIANLMKKQYEMGEGHCLISSNNPYRIMIAYPNETVALFSSSPIMKEQSKELALDGFIEIGNPLYKGLNTALFRIENEVKIQRKEVYLRFLFKQTELIKKYRNHLGDNFETALKTDRGIIFPTINGFGIEKAGEVSLSLDSSEEVYFINMNDGCLVFNHSDQLIFSIGCIWEGMSERPQFITDSDGLHHTLRVKSPSVERLIVTVNGYINKSLFDTTLDSGLAMRNNVYAESVYLGGKVGEEQWLCARPDCSLFSDLYNFHVERAVLYFRNFSKKDIELWAGNLRFLWCTFTTTWDSREEPENWYLAGKNVGDYYEVDVTDLIRSIFSEKSNVSPGFVLRANSEERIILPTGDNSLCPIILEMHLKEEGNQATSLNYY